jgi:hypothetical protein
MKLIRFIGKNTVYDLERNFYNKFGLKLDVLFEGKKAYFNTKLSELTEKELDFTSVIEIYPCELVQDFYKRIFDIYGLNLIIKERNSNKKLGNKAILFDEQFHKFDDLDLLFCPYTGKPLSTFVGKIDIEPNFYFAYAYTDLDDEYEINDDCDTPEEIMWGSKNEIYSVDYIKFNSPFIQKSINLLMNDDDEFSDIKGKKELRLSGLSEGTYKLNGVLVSDYGKLRGNNISINLQDVTTLSDLREKCNQELLDTYEWSENPNFDWDFYGTAKKV